MIGEWWQLGGVATAIGILFSALVGMAVYQNRQISNGRLIPVDTHIRELNSAVSRGDDWKQTALATQAALKNEQDAHAATRLQLTEALQQLQITKMFFSENLPKLPAPVSVPEVGP